MSANPYFAQGISSFFPDSDTFAPLLHLSSLQSRQNGIQGHLDRHLLVELPSIVFLGCVYSQIYSQPWMAYSCLTVAKVPALAWVQIVAWGVMLLRLYCIGGGGTPLRCVESKRALVFLLCSLGRDWVGSGLKFPALEL